MLTNAQLQARIEALENTIRVIVNQDTSRIQPVGAVAAAGYDEGNGRAAASNHVHSAVAATPYVGVPSAVTMNVYDTEDTFIQFTLDGDVPAGSFLQGFVTVDNEASATSLVVTDTQSNIYTAGPVFGAGSVWIATFTCTTLTLLDHMIPDRVTLTWASGTTYRGVIIAEYPAGLSYPPLSITSATGHGTTADSGMTAVLPQPACFVTGIVSTDTSLIDGGSNLTAVWTSGPATNDGYFAYIIGIVDSTAALSLSATLATSADWAALVAVTPVPGGPWSLHAETAKVIYDLADSVRQLRGETA